MTPRQIILDIPPGLCPGAPAHRLSCREWGNPMAAQTLVCVHGLTRNARDFDMLAQALSTGYRVLCPDMPGRGDSAWIEPPAAYAYPLYVADMLFLLGTLAPSRPVHWLGTSMGGIIGMMLAASAPGHISAMVLNDIGCSIPAHALKRIASYVGIDTAFASRAEAETRLRALCAPFGITEENHWRLLFDGSIVEKDSRFHLAYDPAIAVNFNGADLGKDVDLWPFMPALSTIPLLLIRGAESDILPRATAMEMQARHPRMALCEIENAGHAPALMAPEQVRIIKEWLETQHG